MLASHAKSSSTPSFIRSTTLCVLCLHLLAASSPKANAGSNLTNFLTETLITEQSVIALVPGEPVRRKMAGGETHTFGLRLTEGQFSRVVVEQLGIDVDVRIKAPDGQVVAVADSPNGLHGPESVSAVAQVSGDYVVEVRSGKNMPEGRYELRVEGPRAPTQVDMNRVTAERLFTEAQKLRSQGTAESRKQAIEKYREALAVWNALGDAHRRAYTACNIGRTYMALGNITEALAYLNQALLILREAQDISGQSWVLNEIGAVYRNLGNPRQALEPYESALKLRERATDQWGQAQVLNNIGLTYSNMGYQHQTIEHYQRAVPLWQAAGDRGREAITLNNVGLLYTDLGDLSFALDNLQRALKVSREVGDRKLEADVLNNIGRIYDTWADAQTAFRYYDDALKIFRELKLPEGEALVLDNIGMAYAGLGDAERALEFFNRALAIHRQSERPEPRGLGITLTNIGYAHTIQGNHREALKYFDLALPHNRKAENRRFIAFALVSKGLAHASLGETRAALESYRQALELQKEMQDRRGQAITLDGMGQVYAATGSPAQALDNYNQALQHWIAIGDKQGQALTLYAVARVERDQRNLTAARDHIEEAISIVETLRYKMTGQQLRQTYFAGKHDLYALAVDVRMRLYDVSHLAADMEAALSSHERARARNLLDLLAEAHADLTKGMSPEEAEKSRRLEQELNALAQSALRLRNSRSTEDAAAVENRLGKLTTEYDDLQAKIRAASPSYAELKRQQPLKASEIQQLLDADTVLLEYALAEGRSYLWAVTQTEVKSYPLPGQAEIEKAAAQFREAITAYEPPKQGESNESKLQYLTRLNKASVQTRQRALELGRMVLGPVSSQLGNKRLVIVADGTLQYIPFEALTVPGATGRTQAAADDGAYVPLILEHEVVYQPSASALAFLRGMPRARAVKTVAVVADPVFDSKDERVPASVRGAGTAPAHPLPGDLSRALRDLGDMGDADFKLERLRHTASEADAITAAAEPGSWSKSVGFKARRAAVLTTDLSQFKIVHFATHGLLNAKNPELSGIVLSMVNERGQPEDGFLRLRDIYNLNLPVDLVVLSACRTGIGKLVRGEGLIGLTRGFMYAGTPRVVASLWRVDDEATAELMKRFYSHMLKDKMTAVAALRQARIEIMGAREVWREPYFWAGFVLQGDWK